MIFLWIFFFKINQNTSKRVNKGVVFLENLQSTPNKILINFFLITTVYSYIHIYTYRGVEVYFLFNHFFLTNFSLFLINIFLFINLINYLFLKNFFKKNN